MIDLKNYCLKGIRNYIPAFVGYFTLVLNDDDKRINSYDDDFYDEN